MSQVCLSILIKSSGGAQGPAEALANWAPLELDEAALGQEVAPPPASGPAAPAAATDGGAAAPTDAGSVEDAIAAAKRRLLERLQQGAAPDAQQQQQQSEQQQNGRQGLHQAAAPQQQQQPAQPAPASFQSAHGGGLVQARLGQEDGELPPEASDAGDFVHDSATGAGPLQKRTPRPALPPPVALPRIQEPTLLVVKV